MNITGNTILITGGATGIGYALASALMKAGNEIVICGRRENKLKKAAKDLPGIKIKVCDITDFTASEALIKWMKKEHPSFNVLINNAGIQQMLDFTGRVPVEAIAKEINTNFTAAVYLANLSIKHFLKKKKSSLVNITSGLAYIPLALMPVYCASKSALHAFSVSLRHQLKNTGIKVFEIIPPMVDTDLDRGSREGHGQEDRGIPPDDVAKETLISLKSDIFEHSVGMAKGLYNAAHSDKARFVFNKING